MVVIWQWHNDSGDGEYHKNDDNYCWDDDSGYHIDNDDCGGGGGSGNVGIANNDGGGGGSSDRNDIGSDCDAEWW